MILKTISIFWRPIPLKLTSLFDQSNLSRYQAFLQSQGISPATIKRKFSSISSFQKFLIKKKLLNPSPTTNPSARWAPPLDRGGKTLALSRERVGIGFGSGFRRYLTLATLLILSLALGYGLYAQTILKARKQLAYTTATDLKRAGRYLSFQGRLTDTAGNPVASSTPIRFILYDTDVGGTSNVLYDSYVDLNGGGVGATAATPDTNGIFSVIIGKTHGDEIPQSVFSEHTEVWLGIVVNGETMDQRQQLATVAYAMNAETLQGLPPSASGLKNTVLVIGDSGYIYLGETSPSIISNSGTLGIEGQAILLTATNGSGGDIKINPDTNGQILFDTEGNVPSGIGGLISATNGGNLNSGNLYYGSVGDDGRGYNFLQFQNYNIGDTSALVTRFEVAASGNVNVGATLNSINLSIGNTLITASASKINYLTDIGSTNGSIVITTSSNRFNNLIQGNSGQLLQSNGDNQTPTWINANSIGASSVPFSGITTGTNIQALMTVGAGSSLTSTSTGIIDANRLAGLAYDNLPYVTNTTNTTLTRTGAGPYTLGLNLGSTNTWTAPTYFTNNVAIGTSTASTSLLYLAGSNSIFKIGDTLGNTFFEVTDTAITSNLPHNFTSSGDVSMAYDLLFTNAMGSFIKSTSSLNIEAGEPFGSSNLTLKTYNQGKLIIDTANLWSDGTNVGIATTAPTQLFQIGIGSSAFVVTSTGLVGIGTTLPLYTLQVNGAAVATKFGVGGTSGTYAFYTNASGIGITGNSVFSDNLTVGGTLTLSASTVTTATGTTALFIDPSTNVVTRRALGALAFQDATTSTYNWVANASSAQTIGAGTTLSFAGTNGLTTTSVGTSRITFGLGGTLTADTNLNLSTFDLSFLGTGGTQGLFLSADGNVGIGTAGPTAHLTVAGTTNYAPSLTYGAVATAAFQAGNVELAFGTGVGSPWAAWMQARQSSNVAWPLLLNPLGGNVGIGTTNPGSPLHIYKDQSRSAMTGSAKGLLHLWAGDDYSAGDLTAITFGGGYSGDVVQSIIGQRITAGGGNLFFGTSNAWGTITNTAMYITGGGNVGIGTTNPLAALDVVGAIKTSVGITSPALTLTATGYGANKLLQSDASGNATWVSPAGIGGTYTAGNGITLAGTVFKLGGALTEDTRLNIGATEVIFFKNSSGNVGIGTTGPTTLLDVNGYATVADTVNDGRIYFGRGSTYGYGGTNALYLRGGAGNWYFTGLAGEELTINLNAGGASSMTFAQGNLIINANEAGKSLNLQTQGSTGFTLLAGGNVGIGTTNPVNLLDVQSTATSVVINAGNTVAQTQYSELALTTDRGSGLIWKAGSLYTSQGGTAALNIYNTSGPIAFHPSGIANVMFLNTTGLGIGTSNPGKKLDVIGDIRGSTDLYLDGSDATRAIKLYYNSAVFSNYSSSITQTGAGDIYGSQGLVINENTGNAVTNYGIGFATAGTNKMFIQYTGKVGIGTTNPLAALDVVGAIKTSVGLTSPALTLTASGYGANKILQSDASGNATWVSASGIGGTYTATNGLTLAGTVFKLGGALSEATRLNIGSTEVMYLSTVGNIGIGTTGPGTKLAIQANATDGLVNFLNASAISKAYLGLSVATNQMIPGSAVSDLILRAENQKIMFSADAGATAHMTILNTGNVGIGTTAPKPADGSARTLQIGNRLVIQDTVGYQTNFSNNAYFDGSWKRIVSGYSSGIRFNTDSSGNIAFHSATTGAAESAITTWDGSDVKMTILNTGSVGIGTAAPLAKLAINGGLHVGGDSDPGDNNALIDGSLTVTGTFDPNGAITFPATGISGAGAGSGLDADLLDGIQLSTLAESLRSNNSLTGGGTITVDASYNVNWNARFIVISNGNGSDFSTSGYFDVTAQGVGTSITGVGGAASRTWGATGVLLDVWEALYYILPIGSGYSTVAANYRIASYTSALVVPANWVLIAVRNGDTQHIRFSNGINLLASQTWNTSTNSSAFVPNSDLLDGQHGAYYLNVGDTGDYIQNQFAANQTADLRISGNGMFGGKVGIGATNNLYLLNVGGTANFNNLFTSGSVGIGTTLPSGKLHVAGDTYFGTAAGTVGNLYLYGSTAGAVSTLATSNGNLHIDAYTGAYGTYLNYYRGTGGVLFGNGASGSSANVSAAGAYTGTSLNVGAGTITSGLINGQDIDSTANFTGTLYATGKISSGVNGAAYFQGGDDATLNDVNAANTVGIYGVQNTDRGYIQFGSGGGSLGGVSNVLSYNGNTVWHAGNDGTTSGLDADLLDGQHGAYYAPLGNISGTNHYVAKFNGTSALENSVMFDDGTNVGIGTTAPYGKLTVADSSLSVAGGYVVVESPTTNQVLVDFQASATGLGSDTGATITSSNDYVLFGRNSVKYVMGGAGGNIYLNGGGYFSSTSTTTFTGTIYVRKSDGSDPGGLGMYIYTTGGNGVISTTRTAVGNGWYKYVGTHTPASPGTVTLYGLYNFSAGTHYLAGFQIESGSTSSSYVFGSRASGDIVAGGKIQGINGAYFNGNVGIGTTNPNTALAVVGVSGAVSIYDSQTASYAENAPGGKLRLFTKWWSGGPTQYREANIEALHGYGDGGAGTHLVFRVNDQGADTISEKMRITSLGSVGIGTTLPGTKLEVNGDLTMTTGGSNSIVMNRAAVFFAGNDDCNAAIYSNISGSNCYLASHGSDTLAFNGYNGIAFATRASGDAVRMYIQDSTGNVGIGTTGPLAALHVVGATSTDAAMGNLFIQTSGAQAANVGGHISFGGAYTDAGAPAEWAGISGRKNNSTTGQAGGYLTLSTRTDGGSTAERVRIDSTGNVGIGTSPSTKLHVSHVQNAESLITLSNNRQDLGNVPIFGISAQNANIDVAKISFYRGGASSSGYITFSTYAGGASLSEKVRIDEYGLVGIGTPSPLYPLDIATTTAAGYSAKFTGSLITAGIYDANNTLYMLDPANSLASRSSLSLYAAGSIRFNAGYGTTVAVTGYAPSRIQNFPNGLLLAVDTGVTSAGTAIADTDWNSQLFLNNAGNVGIGTTGPNQKLEVTGNLTFSGTQTNSDFNTFNNGIVFPSGSGGLSNQGSAITGKAASTGWGGILQFITRPEAGGAALERMTIRESGNVGIGTASPLSKLSINGGLHVGGDSDAGDNNILADGTISAATGATGGFRSTTYTAGQNLIWAFGNASGYGFSYQQGGPDDIRFHFGNYAAPQFLIRSDGNVGIGTTAPLAKLAINGGLHVGGDSDPGDNNALIDGSLTITGTLDPNGAITFPATGISGAGAGSGLDADLLDGYGGGVGGSYIMNNVAGNWGVASASTLPDYTNASLEVREANLGGAQTGITGEAPRISFHWSGRVASQIGMGTDGTIRTFDNPGTGYEDFAAKLFLAANGTVGGPAYSFTSDTNTGIYSGGADILRLATAGANRVTIAADGNVGIGTTDPKAQLAVLGSIYAMKGIANPYPTAGTGVFMEYYTTGDYGYIGAYDRDTDTQKAMTIKASNFHAEATTGFLGVGKTGPSVSVDAVGGMRARGGDPGSGGVNNNGYAFNGSGDYDSGMFSPADGKIEFFANASRMMQLNTSGLGIGWTNPNRMIQLDSNTYGDTTGWTDASDRAIKENFTHLSNATMAPIKLGTWTGNGSTIDAIEYDSGNLVNLNAEELLKRLSLLPINRYNFIKESDTNLLNPGAKINRIGPTAQDFYKAFGLGSNDTSIRATDMAGVALAGIKALNEKLSDISITDTGEINITYNIDDSVLASLGYDGAKNEIEAAQYSLTDSIDNSVNRIAQFGKIAVAKIEAGLVTSTNIVTKNIISQLNISKQIKTDLVSPLSGDTVIVDGNLTASTGSFSTLIATDIQSSNAEFDTLTANSITGSEATITGTLYADNIISKEGSFGDIMALKISSLRSEIQKLIAPLASGSAESTPSALLAESENWSANIASDSATITGDLSLTDNLVVGAQLYVGGDTHLGNAFISGSLNIADVTIHGNFIETTNTALYIQPEKKGTIYFLGDTMIIADTGEVTINGNLNVTGLARLNEVSAAHLTAQSATVSGSLISKLLIADDATISGTLATNDLLANKISIATDSATIIIASGIGSSVATSSATISTNATAGTATLPAGATELIVQNNHLTDSSMVYLTPVGSTNNQVIYLKNKFTTPTPSPAPVDLSAAAEASAAAGLTTPNTFTIAIDEALASDININWWIIN